MHVTRTILSSVLHFTPPDVGGIHEELYVSLYFENARGALKENNQQFRVYSTI